MLVIANCPCNITDTKCEPQHYAAHLVHKTTHYRFHDWTMYCQFQIAIVAKLWCVVTICIYYLDGKQWHYKSRIQCHKPACGPNIFQWFQNWIPQSWRMTSLSRIDQPEPTAHAHCRCDLQSTNQTPEYTHGRLHALPHKKDAINATSTLIIDAVVLDYTHQEKQLVLNFDRIHGGSSIARTDVSSLPSAKVQHSSISSPT